MLIGHDFEHSGIFLPLITTNCAVLGIAIVMVTAALLSLAFMGFSGVDGAPTNATCFSRSNRSSIFPAKGYVTADFVLYNVTNGIFCITFPNEIFNSFV